MGIRHGGGVCVLRGVPDVRCNGKGREWKGNHQEEYSGIPGVVAPFLSGAAKTWKDEVLHYVLPGG